MTRIDDIRELYDFNRWANHRILEVAGTLTEAQYAKDLRSSYPSVQATLAHVAQAEWIWLERQQGASPVAPPEGWPELSLAALRERWAVVERAQAAALAGLSDGDLDEVLSYRTLSGEPFTSLRWQVLRHNVNHSTYHRGQLVTLLRQLGATPPSTDLIRYYREVATAVTAPGG